MDPTNSAIDSELLNVLIRLMTPFRRKFQQSLNVNLFLVDSVYAMEVMEQLLTTDDPRILDAANFLRERMRTHVPAQAVALSVPNLPAGPAQPAMLAEPNDPNNSELAPELSRSQSEQVAKYVKRLR